VEVPQFDRHIRTARSKQFAREIKRNVLHAIGMTFQCSFEITALEVPYLENMKNIVFYEDSDRFGNTNYSRALLL